MTFEKDAFIKSCAEHLRCSPTTLLDGVSLYNADFAGYDNAVYARIETRIAHWLNFHGGDWFTNRLRWPLENARNYDLVVDLGFSVPYAYLSPVLVAADRPVWMLIDKERSARDFYDLTVTMLNRPELSTRDQLVLLDLEDDSSCEKIEAAVARITPASVLMIASEVIEHLKKPENVWSIAAALHRSVPRTHIYTTLPVGRRIPSHELEFRDVAAAADYCKAHMNVEWEQTLLPPVTAPASPYLQACYCALGRVS